MKLLFTGLWRSLRASARRRSLAMLAASMLASCMAMAAVVSMHPPSGGGDLRIPVMLYGDGEETVSGIEFDLNFDPAQFELVEITAGNVATDAGKQVVFSETLPGQGRVLVTGFNNVSMADGQIATLTLRPLTSTSAQSDIALDRALATDPDGNNVPIDYADLFQYPPAAPEPVEDTGTQESPGSDDATDTGEATDDGSDPTPVKSPQEESPGTDGTVKQGNPGVFPGGSFGTSDLDAAQGTDPRAGKNANRAGQSVPSHSRNGLGGRNDISSRAGYPARTQRGGAAPANDVQSKSPSARGPINSANNVGVLVDNPPESASNRVPPPPRGARPKDSALALARNASGVLDPAGTGLDSSYTLAFESAEGLPEQSTRVSVFALVAGLLLSLLALYHVLFGRGMRRQRRNVR